MAKSKLIDEVIQEDVVVSEELVAEVKKAVAPKDAYAMPEPKKVVEHPGHARRDFRN
jgi:hypothetical protein